MNKQLRFYALGIAALSLAIPVAACDGDESPPASNGGSSGGDQRDPPVNEDLQ